MFIFIVLCGYQIGFGNEFVIEVVFGVLLVGCNLLQWVVYGLYVEQLFGMVFIVFCGSNCCSWVYWICLVVIYGEFIVYVQLYLYSDFVYGVVLFNQLCWNLLLLLIMFIDFIDGLYMMGGNGVLDVYYGVGIYLYVVNVDMQGCYFYNVDGELLIVLEFGCLCLFIELGVIEIELQQIVVMLCGVCFWVELFDGQVCGYICENFGVLLKLFDLGLIGFNGLVNLCDFEILYVVFEDIDGVFELIVKFGGQLWCVDIDYLLLDVVVWYGNYVLYCYDLCCFNMIGLISYDYLDLLIFLVLYLFSDMFGISNMDFVIFLLCWLVVQDIFCLLWFYCNIVSEFMGLIYGVYDVKVEGFVLGGVLLYNCMSGYGLDVVIFDKVLVVDLSRLDVIKDMMVFMFEICGVICFIVQVMDVVYWQCDYQYCWQGLKVNFFKQ